MKRAKGKDKPVYAFIRKGNSLVPEMAYDLTALDGIANGERVSIDIKQWRNLARLRAYWATLRDVIDATECAANVEALHKLLKLECGLVDIVRLPSGLTYAVPGSIAIEILEEADMVKFFAAAEKYLAETFGYVREAA